MIRSAVTVSLVPEAQGGPFVFWHDLPSACQTARELGFDGIEIFPPGPEAVDVPAVRALLADHGLELATVGTGAGWVKHKRHLCLPDAAARQQAREFIQSIIDVAGPLGETRLYVRQVEGATPVAVTAADVGFARTPRWSPDGGRLLFHSPRGLEVVPALGGPAKLLAPVARGAWADGTWSPDGRSIAFALGDSVHVRLTEGGATRGLARLPIDSVPPSDRRWEDLAELGAMLADPGVTRRALAGFEQDLMPTSREPAGRRAFFSAHAALAEGRWDEAIALLHEADARKAVDERYAQAQLGRAHDLAGRPDSALGYYERFLAIPDPFPIEDTRWRPRVHRWLGAIYESRGEHRKAMEQYARFLELWGGADAELQPQVKEVRDRLERLRTAVG